MSFDNVWVVKKKLLMQLDAHAKLASDELAVNVKLQLVVSQVYNCLNYRYLNESEITK